MKTLYISDLDGTLLKNDVTVSDFAKAGIEKIINAGDYFTAATARTYSTVSCIFKEITVNAPIILMNGVCIYDTQKGAYELAHSIPKENKKSLIEAIANKQITVFIFVLEDNKLSTYYEEVRTKIGEIFIEERKTRYKKSFTKINSFEDIIDKNWIYISVSDTKDNLQDIYDKLSHEKNLNIEFYHDIYSQEHMYLEVSSDKASKYNAVKYLRENYNFDRIIGFGDNLNDIPLAHACDEFYAVENAKDEVKQVANAVIGKNEDDGVIKYILNR